MERRFEVEGTLEGEEAEVGGGISFVLRRERRALVLLVGAAICLREVGIFGGVLVTEWRGWTRRVFVE